MPAEPDHPRDAIDAIVEQWGRERPDLDTSPMALVGRIARANLLLQREVDALFERSGLPAGGFDVLATLRRSGEPYRLSPTQLFRAVMIASGSMTARLDRLQGLGLVERSPDPRDRRALLVGLTPAGRDLVDRVVTEHVANEERLLAGLDAADREALGGVLRRLLVGLGDVPPA